MADYYSSLYIHTHREEKIKCDFFSNHKENEEEYTKNPNSNDIKDVLPRMSIQSISRLVFRSIAGQSICPSGNGQVETIYQVTG